MEFYIKKNATLPYLQFEVSKNGRSDYDKIYDYLNATNVYISLIDYYTKTPKILSKSCSVVSGYSESNNTEIIYYIRYQFTNEETNDFGKYYVELSIIDEQGSVILPLKEKIYVNVIDSFSIDDYPFSTDYIVSFPCC